MWLKSVNDNGELSLTSLKGNGYNIRNVCCAWHMSIIAEGGVIQDAYGKLEQFQ
jgi:hypothetical protein